MTRSETNFTAEAQRTPREATWPYGLARIAFLTGTILLAACQHEPRAMAVSPALPTLNGQSDAAAKETVKHRGSPTQTADAFIAALQAGDVVAARKLLAIDSGLPQKAHNEINERLQRMANSVARGWQMNVVAERVDENRAVVILHDRNPTTREPRTFVDLDPMFLVLHDCTWLIMLDNPTRSTNVFPLTREQQMQFMELHNWYQDASPQLQAKLKAESALEN